GPHPVLSADIAACLRHRGESGTVLASLRRSEPERAALLGTLGALYVQGQPVAWERLADPGARCVALPPYPWQRERCWLDVTATAAWTLHASGKVRLGANGNGNGNGHAPQTIDEIRGRCRDEVGIDDYYEQLRGRGLEYGPAFRGIAQLWRGRGEALGRVE